MERNFGFSFGKGLTVPDLFNEFPHIDEVDPEFLLDLFERAKEKCTEYFGELNGYTLVRTANILSNTEFKEEFRPFKGNGIWQLGVSLSDPGLEVVKYLPKIAKRLGMNIDREFKPLWDYIEPDFMTRLNFGHWNKVSHILDDLPDLAKKLYSLDRKPTFYLLNRVTEHGTTAAILGDEIQVAIRANLDESDTENANFFSGNLGPKVLQITDKWIVEEFFEYPHIEINLHQNTQDPFTYGKYLGQALSEIHNLGFSYNRSLEKNVFIDQDGKLRITNWCNARRDDKTSSDIKTTIQILKNRHMKYLGKSENHVYPQFTGTLPYLKSLKGFYEGYNFLSKNIS